jgi:hypothetical protein
MANIGDLVPKSGVYTEPGVVIEKREDGNVVIDTEPMQVNKYHRYTNTTGLTEMEKGQFNTILDQIYAKTNDLDRINDIQTEIDKLKMDPKSKNIVQYLRNQQAHLIRSARKLPQTYQADEATLKK